MDGYFIHRVQKNADGEEFLVEFGTTEKSYVACRCDDSQTASDIAAAMNLATAMERFITGTVTVDIVKGGPIGEELRSRFQRRSSARFSMSSKSTEVNRE